MSSTSTIPQDWSSLSALNHEFEELIDDAASWPPGRGFQTGMGAEGVVRDVRALRGDGSATASEPWADVQERDISVVMRDGAQNRIRIYEAGERFGAEARVGPGPIFVMIHGGGFCVGSLESEEDICRRWARRFKGTSLSIEHRLAPEVEFPVPVDDCWDILLWIVAELEKGKDGEIWGLGGVDAKRGFVLGGTSSGSTAAIILAHMARDTKMEPPLTGLYLSHPTPCHPSVLPSPYDTDARVTTPGFSWTQCANAPIFSLFALKLFSASYASPPAHPLRSPLLWDTGHASLPPTYIQTSGADPGRDLALIYEEVVRRQGNLTKIDIWPGLIHGFWTFFPNAAFTKDWRAKSEQGLVWLVDSDRDGLAAR